MIEAWSIVELRDIASISSSVSIVLLDELVRLCLESIALMQFLSNSGCFSTATFVQWTIMVIQTRIRPTAFGVTHDDKASAHIQLGNLSNGALDRP